MDETVVITGAGSGLGAELALRFSGAGRHVCLLGRNRSKLESVAGKLQGTCSIYEADVSVRASVRNVMDKILSDRGSIDILVNNAGVGTFKNFEELSDEEIDCMIDINLKGAIYCTREVITGMKKRGGVLLNIISNSGINAKETETVYSASKFGLRGFAQALEQELEDTDVRIMSVYMGNMKTGLWANNDAGNQKGFLDPGDVADLIMSNLVHLKNMGVREIMI